MGRPNRERLEGFVDKINRGYTVQRLMSEEALREDSVRRYIGWCRKDGLLPNGTRISGSTVVSGKGSPISPIARDFRTINKKNTGNNLEVSVTSSDVDTVEKALEKAGVDTNRWAVDRFVISSREIEQKKWQHEVFGEDFGPLWTVKVWLKPVVVDFEEAARSIAESFKKASTSVPVQNRSRQPCPGIMCELCFPDLHIGKYAWSRETGESYDVNMAVSVLEKAMDELLARAKAMNPELILIPIGNDLLHVDNLEGATTKGTSLDVDSRYQRVFEETVSALLRLVDKAREIAPIQIIIVPGNHDELASFHVGEVLRGWYGRCDDVLINNEPTTRKYFRWGTNLFGFVHGGRDDPNPKDLPLLMAVEMKKDWAETSHREIQAGHIHKRKQIMWTSLNSEVGVHFRILPSLCATDAWHARNGFVGQPRVAEMYIYSKSDGYVGHFSSKDYKGEL